MRELKGFGYRQCGIGSSQEEPYYLKEHIYTFVTKKKNRFIVRVEEYRDDLFVLKFHLKNHTESRLKYCILANIKDDTRRIIETCISIGHAILATNPLASFAFMGSPTVTEIEKGDYDSRISKTKRFGLYQKFAVNYFRPENFNHYMLTSNSCYILVNNRRIANAPEDEYIYDALEFFSSIYDFKKYHDELAEFIKNRDTF